MNLFDSKVKQILSETISENTDSSKEEKIKYPTSNQIEKELDRRKEKAKVLKKMIKDIQNKKVKLSPTQKAFEKLKNNKNKEVVLTPTQKAFERLKNKTF